MEQRIEVRTARQLMAGILVVSSAACSLDWGAKNSSRNRDDAGHVADAGGAGRDAEGGAGACVPSESDPCTDLACNGKARTAYYTDADGDDHGVGDPTYACEPPPGTASMLGDCDDEVAARNESADEVCDGLDNDCDEQTDDGFACIQGAEVTCTTSCGSSGAGSCTDVCTLPTGLACKPPMEVCNLIDDDCDGIADQGMQNVIDAPGVWAYPGATASTGTDLSVSRAALLRKADAGAWLAYSAQKGSSVPAAVTFAELDAQGALVTLVASATDLVADTTTWVADSDGKVIAFVERQIRSDGRKAMRIQLMRASDLAAISSDERIVTTTSTRDVEPLDAAVQGAEDGTVRVAVVYRELLDPQGPSYATKLAVFSVSAQGVWAYDVTATLAATGLTAAGVAVEPMPCQRGFVTSYASSGARATQIWDRAAGVSTSVTVSMPSAAVAITGLGSSCAAGSGEVALAYIDATNATHLHAWSVDALTGDMQDIAPELTPANTLYNVSFARRGGRWYAAGLNQVTSDDRLTTRLWELSFADASLRELPLSSLTAGARAGTSLSLVAALAGRTAIVDAGTNLVAAYPNGFDVGSNLQSYLASGAPPAVLVTYPIGCAP